MKILYLRTMDIMKKWANPISNRGIIRGKPDLLWGAGFQSHDCHLSAQLF